MPGMRPASRQQQPLLLGGEKSRGTIGKTDSVEKARQNSFIRHSSIIDRTPAFPKEARRKQPKKTQPQANGREIQLRFGIFLLLGNKMSRFEETPQDRAERHRKHQLYKQMLDEQMNYKQNRATQPLMLTSNYYPTAPPPNHRSQLPPLPLETRRSPEDERTDRYLNNCEDIIRSLRDMKAKKQVQYTLQRNDYYPRPSYFSVVQAPLAHSEVQSPRMRTIDSREPARTNKIRSDRSGKLQTEANPEKYNQRSMRIKPTKNSKVSPKAKPMLSPRQKSKSPRSKSRDSEAERQQKLRQEEERKAERRKEHENLSECLVQLSRYLRSQQLQQQRKESLKNEEVQVDDPRLDQSKRQAKMHELKLKALLALRRINNRGQDFVDKMEDRGKSNQQSQSRIKSDFQKQLEKERKQSRNSAHSDAISPREEQIQQQNEELMKLMVEHLELQQDKNQELTDCLRELTDYLRLQSYEISAIRAKSPPAQQKRQVLSRSNPSPKQTSPKNKPKQVRNQEYPKPAASPKRSASPKPKPKPQPVKQEPTKQEQAKLRQAFLKRLKKARMRGSLLNEKVETYKKQHSPDDEEDVVTQAGPQPSS